MHAATRRASPPQKNQAGSMPGLVKRIFGGRLETSYTCLTCSTRSTDTDWFTDLHLAIPAVVANTNTAIATNSANTSNQVVPIATSTQTSSTTTANQTIISQDSTGSTDTGQSTSETQTVSNNDQTVMPHGDSPTATGSMPSTAVSSNSEPSGVPSPSTSVDISCLAVKSPEPAVNGKLGVSDLITSYLAPEQMDGDNQYQCDSCVGLRDAVKTVRLASSPAYLNITLLRFKYDRAMGRRAKVFTPVDYPQRLELPVVGGSVEYQLYSVVVHSGYSSDGGHYYTWARPDLNAPGWLILNDSQVTEASWSQFCSQASKLSRDTAYLLGYQRVEQNSVEETTLESSPPRHLMDRVHKDNMKYLRERETLFKGVPGPRKEDDGGGSGSGGCPDNFGQFGGGHYIC